MRYLTRLCVFVSAMERTCFGMSLEQLVCCSQPVAMYAYPSIAPPATPSPLLPLSLGSATMYVPKELARLLDIIYRSEVNRTLYGLDGKQL